MRLVFAGTPHFAASALDALSDAGHEIPLVLTQPDRPFGRGMRPASSAVKQAALSRGLPVAQPESLKSAQALELLEDAAADLMVVAAYGLILPPSVLQIFPFGCVNIHASLLPRWRGAAPIQRAIQAGDSVTGITIMRMEAGLDTGPMLLSEAIPIDATDTAGTLHEKLERLGARLVVEALRMLASGTLEPKVQDDRLATYAAKIAREDAEIDWRRSALDIDRCIRAFNPVPGATARLRDETIKIWEAAPTGIETRQTPGEVVVSGSGGVSVACGDGHMLALSQLQKPGSKRLSVTEFLRGFPLRSGERFSLPET